MAVLDCVVELETPTVVATKPPRLNFARRCVYCLERDCDSPECEAMYARSRWAVCPECDGREGDEVTSVSCEWCTFGVVELAPMAAEERGRAVVTASAESVGAAGGA